jgi:hypothetical protein
MAATTVKIGSRIYFVDSPFSAKAAIKSIGGHWDADRRQWWVGLAKKADADMLVVSMNTPVPAEQNGTPKQQDPHEIRLTGKGRYKDREYYAGAITRDGQRVRLLTLPDATGKYLDFWAPCSEVEQTKVYHAREYRGRAEYTTLGGIADYVARQRRAESAGEPACPCCGKRGGLVEDLEDGLMKCYSCCDMPVS